MINTKSKRIAFATLAVLIFAISMIVVMAGAPQVKAEEIATFGASTPGVTGTGTELDPYIQSTWNGRIESTENLHDNYFANISIDVRDCGIFHDDALVAFQYYHLDTKNDKIATSLPMFSAKLTFSDKKGNYEKNAGTSNSKNWEYLVGAGKFNINKVRAVVTLTDGKSVKTIYYNFG